MVGSRAQEALDEGAVEVTREDEMMATAAILSETLKALAQAASAASEKPSGEVADRVREELRLAAAELDQLAVELDQGARCEEVRPLLGKLGARRLAFIEIGRAATSNVLPPEQLGGARALWEALAAKCRGEAPRLAD
jgi:hypothetical protein